MWSQPPLSRSQQEASENVELSVMNDDCGHFLDIRLIHSRREADFDQVFFLSFIMKRDKG